MLSAVAAVVIGSTIFIGALLVAILAPRARRAATFNQDAIAALGRIGLSTSIASAILVIFATTALLTA